MAIDTTIAAYFSHLVSTLAADRDVRTLAIAHMVPNTLHFLPAVNEMTALSAVLAKPKSVRRPEFGIINGQYETIALSREWAANPDSVVETLYELGLKGEKILLLDIGGYFANSVGGIANIFDGQILGVLEGTENGLKRYERTGRTKYPR